MSWKISVRAPRKAVEAALLSHEDAITWDESIAIAGREIAPDRPEEWVLEAWLERKPTRDEKAAITRLFGDLAVADVKVEQLPDIDWVAESQKGLEPIRAGRFFVHTPDYPENKAPGTVNFVVPAGQAFGTGHHETTAGCLAMLERMKRLGTSVRNCADVGTGTGILAFAALALWPRAIVTASDIDPQSAHVTMENAALNHVPVGARGGELTVTVADGMAHPLIAARGPYDLVIANILAGPLVALAPTFGRALVPGGNLLLAGLLTRQEPEVRLACRRAGFRLAAREVRGDWSILWLRKRPSLASRDRMRMARRASNA
ncbi:MAG: 50S ribosomal protein L11 methyltransferase [Novosphingobium sp.]|nr:50S ribosomal protein L11 methyltransferase [Novosphingobium sp.]